MKDWLIFATEYAVVLIQWLALVIIVGGTLQAFAGGLMLLVAPAQSRYTQRAIWARYGRWLIAGLTFQLAADIAKSAITTNWDAVGQLAAIAVIRTFLNYFLERDLRETASEHDEPTVAR